MPKSKKDIVKATSSGRLYVETNDFFTSEKIITTIQNLLNSNIIKAIEERKKKSNLQSL